MKLYDGNKTDNLSDSDNQKLIENYTSLFSPKMWSYLTNKEYPLIRKAGYSLIATLSKKLPGIQASLYQLMKYRIN